jgi:hypothetical protein
MSKIWGWIFLIALLLGISICLAALLYLSGGFPID